MNDREIARIATAVEERVYLREDVVTPGDLTAAEQHALALRLSSAAGDIVTDILQRRADLAAAGGAS